MAGAGRGKNRAAVTVKGWWPKRGKVSWLKSRQVKPTTIESNEKRQEAFRVRTDGTVAIAAKATTITTWSFGGVRREKKTGGRNEEQGQTYIVVSLPSDNQNSLIFYSFADDQQRKGNINRVPGAQAWASNLTEVLRSKQSVFGDDDWRKSII